MFRSLFAIVLALAVLVDAFGCSAPAPSLARYSHDLETFSLHIQRSTVTVKHGDSVGAGFVTRQGIVTAAHNVPDTAFVVTIVDCDGKEWKTVPVAAADPLFDVALLRLPAGFNRPPLAFGAGRKGMPVLIFGSPLGLEFSVSHGIVAREGGLDLFLSAVVNPGDSGGAVVNYRGEVVGMLSLVLDPPYGSGLGVAVDSVAIQAAIASITQRSSTP